MIPKTPLTSAFEVTTRNAPVASSARFAQTDGRPQRTQRMMRSYEVVHLLPNGDIDDFTRLAPATPAFENSFGAIARGGVLKTDRGTVAIEDILPGDAVKTVENGFQTVLWRGAMSVVPSASLPASATSGASTHKTPSTKLIRMASDALGIARPMTDLLLGPYARLYHRSPTLQRVTGKEAAFVPAADFIDGINVVEVQPPTAVQVFQLGFAAHERIAVNGVEIDSQNPGARHEFGLRGEMLDLYMTLFPHMDRIEDFGLLTHPRLSLRDLDFGVVA